MTTKKATLRINTETVEVAGGDLSKVLNDWFERHGPDALFRSCANCKHMAMGNNPAHCSKYGMTPPASVIVVGCPEHDDAEVIPF